MRLKPSGLVMILCAQLGFAGSGYAAPDAYIPDRFKGIILYAPVPNYPEAARSHYTLGARGLYRLTINQKSGGIDEVGVMKQAGRTLDSTMVMELFKWKVKPGTLKQLDVPVAYDREVVVLLKTAGSK